MAEAMPALALESVSAGYGDTVVLEDVCVELAAGEAVSIIGRNGVGKTTLLATIMGHTDVHRGVARMGGADMARLSTCRRVRAGLGYVPQEREIFPSLSVAENLAVGARGGRWDSKRVFDLFPALRERRDSRGSLLSGGEQQMLAIGRALVGNPSVLLLDEPSEGLAPVIVETLQATLARLRDEEAMTIVLVEQNSRVALAFARRCLVMNRGRIVRDGESAELLDDPTLLGRLIGVDHAA
jgi:branched-chain amino acid transport system ATP-binding protein